MQIREYFLASRLRRNLSVQKIADSLSLRFGRKVTRASLASWELGRVESPRREVAEAIQWQIEQWRREDKGEGIAVPVNSMREWYSADYLCPGCDVRVPGPQCGARYCLNCGESLWSRECRSCGQVSVDVRFTNCPFCGKEFATGGKL